MKRKTAIVFGATGLIGKNLIEILQKDDTYESVKVFLRKDILYDSSKIEVIKIDFSKLNDYKSLIQGDDLFCCLGTTIKKAGSQEAFKKVDYGLVVQLGAIAKFNQLKSFLVISSLGAEATSSNFYLRVKGEMEEALKKLQLNKLVILRPSLLLGNREEFRLGENIGKIIMKLFSPLLIGKLKKYRGVQANTVATVMVHFASSSQALTILESDEIMKIHKKE